MESSDELRPNVHLPPQKLSLSGLYECEKDVRRRVFGPGRIGGKNSNGGGEKAVVEA